MLKALRIGAHSDNPRRRSVSSAIENREERASTSTKVRWHSSDTTGSGDTSDSLDATLQRGVVLFSVIDGISTRRQSEFLIASDDHPDSVQDIAMAMADHWKVKSPHLVMSIISNDRYFKPWRQQETMNDFQDGLMKAASLTSMWILTNGRNTGFSNIIGQAVIREKNKREFIEHEQNLVRFLTADILPPIIVIGLVSKKALGTSLDLKPVDGVIEDPDCYLHPRFTHFIILDDLKTPENNFNTFAGQIETRLTNIVGKPRRYMQRMGSEAGFHVEVTSTPLVGLLTNSGPLELDRALRLLKRGIPVIVLHGDGSATDLVAFAVNTVKDSLYSEMYVKSELLRRVNVMFPDEFRDDIVGRNNFRDKILQCVSLASQDDCNLITLVNRNNATPSLRDMNKIILKAFLGAQKRVQEDTGIDYLHRNLQLTIDWMNPELAKQEIFKMHSLGTFIVGEELFEQALLRSDREEFVGLFLDQGFILHKYLNQERLGMLFQQCQDKNFFIGTCLEGILGVRMTDEHYISKYFVGDRSSQLNKLIFILTGIKNLIDPYKLTLNASTSVRGDKSQAEQLALHALVFWAALTNRTKLAKQLWNRSTQPMALGLVLSTLYRRLSKYWVADFYLQNILEANGITFGRWALQLLDFTYRESVSQAVFTLTNRLADFQNHTPIEIAIMGKNKHFIAHPCCQRRLYNLWYGQMRIRRSRRWNETLLSDNVKIILCLVFIIPVYTWIDLPEGQDNNEDSTNRSTEDSQEEQQEALVTMHQANVFTKLYHLWAAPVSKFWIAQAFYFLFLFLFGYTLMMPLCGEIVFNLVLIAFLLAYVFDHVYIIVLDRWQNYRDMYMDDNIWAVMIYLLTSVLILAFRIPGYQSSLLTVTTVKILLCFSFVYCSYRAMKDLFPVSQTLGPLLVSITVMIRRDLLTWTRIWLLIMISGSVTVFAVIFPAYPFGWDLLSKAFIRGIFALFTLQLEASNKWPVQYCPYSSLGGYLIALQYIFITKLVFSTLIFAICSVTFSHTFAKAVEIWKYRFCLKVFHYARRPVLPVPLTIVTYPCTLVRCCFTLIRHYCMPFCPCCGTLPHGSINNAEFHTWKVFIQMQKKEEQLKKGEQELPSRIEDRLMTFVRDMKTERKQMDGLKDRLVGALNSQTSVLLLLEKMKHKLELVGAIKKESGRGSIEKLHSNCRNSLYPGTSLHRSVVFDKDVPWEEAFGTYDPVVYSKSIGEYSLEVRPFVDPDAFELARFHEDAFKESLIAPEGTQFFPIYNSIVTRMTTDGDQYHMDRTTFCETDPEGEYTLDDTGVPRNPFGRTGVRGRGNLWRWGPNHMIYAVITRWRVTRRATEGASKKGALAVQGKGELEVLVVADGLLHENVLPGSFITGRTTKYSMLCESFMKDVLKHDDVAGSDTFDVDDMSQFFRQFVISDFHLLGLLGRTDVSAFKPCLVYQGYMDDRNNTDNAWVEAEIWHFHYEKNSFDRTIMDAEKYWQKVRPELQLTKCQIPHVLEAAAKIL